MFSILQCFINPSLKNFWAHFNSWFLLALEFLLQSYFAF